MTRNYDSSAVAAMDPGWYPKVLKWLEDNRPEVFEHAVAEVVTWRAVVDFKTPEVADSRPSGQ